MAQVALAWVTDRPAVTSTILGARTLDQLDDNLAVGRTCGWSATEIEALDAASRLRGRRLSVRRARRGATAAPALRWARLTDPVADDLNPIREIDPAAR